MPARRGSKSIPGKNLVALGGYPLIEWTIRAAVGCQMFSAVYVSTDDRRVVELARCAGLSIIERPDALAGDDASTASVVEHALGCISEDTLVLLQPTSPFRTMSHIREACELHDATGDAIVSVVATEHPCEWAFSISPDRGLLSIEDPRGIPRRRQDARPRYRVNGALFVAKRSSWLPSGDIYQVPLRPYRMDRWSSLDIDEPFDLELARYLVHSSRFKIAAH